MKTYRFFHIGSVWTLLCGLIAGVLTVQTITVQSVFAQQSGKAPAKPLVSFSSVQYGEAIPWLNVPWLKNPKGHSSELFADSVPGITMRERSISLFRRDSAFQTGSVAINRIGGPSETQLVIGYTAEYLDSLLRPLPNVSSTIVQLPAALPNGALVSPPFPAPVPVAINGLQGDLAPTTADANGQQVAVNVANASAPNTANMLPGQNRVLLNFTARWSDQSLSPRSAGLQGRRYVRLTLLRVNDVNYEVGVTLAVVTLDDPLRVGPVIMNAIQNKQLLRNASDLIELETPGFRSDGRPNSVFYDENYNVLTYSVTSSDSTIISARTTQSDARLGGRPSLFYTVQPGAPAGSTVTLTLVADDGTGLLARDIFTIQVVNSITSVSSANDVNFLVTPNPTADNVVVEATARQTGRVRIRLLNSLGAEVLSTEQPVSAGSIYRQNIDVAGLPTGVYFVEVQDGAARSVRKVAKN